MAQRTHRAEIEARYAKANAFAEETLSLAKEKMGTAIRRGSVRFL